jgi:MoxR-like ATPase
MSESEAVRHSALAERVVEALDARVLGQRLAVEHLLAGYAAGGHILLEGVPGIGKTLLARSFADCLGLSFRRIQFTPDLMPTDVTGANVFDPASRSFRLVPGPLFAEILMADEVNRTPPKTQAALLEAMQEGQATIDGVSHPLPPGFFVVATQNPVEFEGTYPLPEAQLDRFLLRVEMTLPAAEAEREMYRRAVQGDLPGWSHTAAAPAVATATEARALRTASGQVRVVGELLGYLYDLASAVRASPHVELAVSPRGALSLLEAARGLALVSGRDFVLPDDLKRLLVPCWAHRLILSAEAELEGHTAASVLNETGRTVPVPHLARTPGAAGEAPHAAGADAPRRPEA